MSRLYFLALLVALSLSAIGKDKKPKPKAKDPQDEITVVGHIPTQGSLVTRFITTDHYSSHYLYVEHAGGKNLTLIDVTRAAQPAVLAEVPVAGSESASLFAVAGTAAVVSAQPPAATTGAEPQTVRIMDLSDPLHPRVSREFTGVTAMSRDDGRGLIFVANGEGIWILHQTFATDPEVEKAYAHHVLYDH